MKIGKKELIKWIQALRSGKYSQTQGVLQSKEGYCCLGVACRVLIPKRKLVLYEDGYIDGGVPEYTQIFAPEWLKSINTDFTNKTGLGLTELNDDEYSLDIIPSDLGAFTFNEIADLLELVYIHKILTHKP